MAARRDRFRKGSPEWIRLGELLQQRRGELDVRYDGHGGRTAFVRDRDINPKLAEDIELNHRENFTPLTLRDTIAVAYSVSYESIRAVLDGSGDLVAAPGAPPRHGADAAQPPPAAAPVSRDNLPAVLQDIDLVALAPYVAQLDADLAEFRPWADKYEADTWRNPGMTIDTKRVLIAMYRMLSKEQAGGSGRSRTGLAAPEQRRTVGET